MKVIILTTEDYVPYEGTSTETIGVFSSREAAEIGMLEHYQSKIDSLKKSLEISPGNTYYSDRLRKYKTPTAENGYEMFRDYGDVSFCFEEFELDKIERDL